MCFQVNIENVVYLRSQLASQLEDARRKLEDDERRRSLLEANLHQVPSPTNTLTLLYICVCIPLFLLIKQTFTFWLTRTKLKKNLHQNFR